MSDASANAAIRDLLATIQARLEHDEDFRALRGLERALVEITQVEHPCQLATLARDAQTSPPVPSPESTARAANSNPVTSLLSAIARVF
jgi:hypothetical protein